MKVHIGCGKRNFGDEWVHIDGSDYDHIQYHDIVNLPFSEGTVDLIYASHVIEYFDRQEILSVLSGWKKCLKQGGILRLAVPDFEAICSLYLDDSYPLDRFIGPLYGRWEMTPNNFIYHKTVYDNTSLRSVLKTCGFNDIRLWNWRDTEHSNFDDYSQAYIPHMNKDNGKLISLNIECKKL